jgi:hypothetical protein
MRKIPKLDRLTAYNLLQSAITMHRRARISLSVSPSIFSMGALKRARSAERRARRAYAPYARADRIDAKVAAMRAARYVAQHPNASRTKREAITLRADRHQRRIAAASAAATKRALNRAGMIPA